MFQTCSAEAGYVEGVAHERAGSVWTLIDGDEGATVIVPGFRLVNRLGCFITRKPWDSEHVVFNLGD